MVTLCYFQLKERCRKGIPPAMRGVAWQHLCGANVLKVENEGLFGVSSISCNLQLIIVVLE